MPELTMGSLFDGIAASRWRRCETGSRRSGHLKLNHSPLRSQKHTSPTWFRSEILQSSTARTCRPWTSSAAAAHVRTALLRPGHAPVCRARVPACFLSRYESQRS